MRADRHELIDRYSFPIDRFQHEAFDALDAGKHVVIAVPTGSGKTVVAEYGIASSYRDGTRSFYTAPIKALSNQKYRDLVEIHGESEVGLLTGDNSINGDAPIVVMTTEVLRNMIYGRNRSLDNLGLVVLDEVHFLQDTYRGPVWEEVMIHLPEHVRLVCLSATVSNAGELAEWITTVRGETVAIVEKKRPVELTNQYLAKDRNDGRLHLLPTFVNGQPNRRAMDLDKSGARQGGGGAGSTHRRHKPKPGSKNEVRRKLVPPSRVETLELLHDHDMLPAIFFIFSRNQCDEAAKSVVESGVVLTSGAERDAIRAIVDSRLAGIDRADLSVLGFDQFIRQLEAGVAAHHAGMVPPMKEVVEACFIAGLIKAVFATETLAVGINMPARTVVIEKLTKFTGEHHEQLTPGEYTQLTGRAGRRGIDDRGNAVVLWSPWVRFDEVANLAGSSLFHLRSAFRPTYNMAANLIRTYDSERAHHMLNLSFAQYQSDHDIVKLQARLERRRRVLAELNSDAESPFGDIEEYRRLRDAEREVRREGQAARHEAIDDGLDALQPGQVINLMKGKQRGPVVVMTNTRRKGFTKLTLVNKGGDMVHAADEDFAEAPQVLGKIKLPPSFAPNRKDYRKEVAYRLRKANLNRPPNISSSRRSGADPMTADLHPVARDPDLRERLHAAGQAGKVRREVRDIEQRVESKNDTLARDFDRVLDVLEHYGYVDVDRWELTADGEMLARVFHESDLLVAEILRDGVLVGLSAADLAAIVSCVVYEHRSPEPPPKPWFSSDDTRQRWQRIATLSDEVAAQERAHGLTEHRQPDPTFAAIAYAWVAGEGFAAVVDDEELTGGDFVRTTRQLIDILRQVANIAPERSVRRAASDAAEAAFRGVVSDSAAPTTTDADAANEAITDAEPS